MRKRMTEPEAWAYLADTDTARHPKQRQSGWYDDNSYPYCNGGICIWIARLSALNHISYVTQEAMVARMGAMMKRGGGYWWPREERGRKLRHLACGFLAQHALDYPAISRALGIEIPR